MAVNIYWGTNNTGTQIIQPLSHGDIANSATSSAFTIWLWHDGINSITNCAFYLAPYTGTYSGSSSAINDYNELLAWGDGETDNAWGGYQINMDAVNSFPVLSWPTRTSNPYSDLGYCINSATNNGMNAANAISLVAEMKGDGEGVDGEIAANSPNGYGLDYKFQCRIKVPSDENTAGKRQFDLVLSYSYTS